MAYELFSKVALKSDVPAHKLRWGDVATIVESHPGRPGQEPGYSLEVFNAGRNARSGNGPRIAN